MPKTFKVKNVRLSSLGTGKVMGELEAKIMEIAWENQDVGVSARDVTDQLVSTKRKISFNSVMTLLNRLASKNILVKKRQKKTYIFMPTLTKDEFTVKVTKDILSSVLKDPTLFNVASFADIGSSLDKVALTKLKKFIDQQSA